MADYVLDKTGFEFTYSAKKQEEVEKIRNKYVLKEESKMEQLIRLDKQAERPGTIASIVIGTIGILILGAGMSCVLVGNSSIEILAVGIVVGIIGMVVAGSAYPIYNKVTKKERKKVAEQIIALSNELSL